MPEPEPSTPISFARTSAAVYELAGRAAFAVDCAPFATFEIDFSVASIVSRSALSFVPHESGDPPTSGLTSAKLVVVVSAIDYCLVHVLAPATRCVHVSAGADF